MGQGGHWSTNLAANQTFHMSSLRILRIVGLLVLVRGSQVQAQTQESADGAAKRAAAAPVRPGDRIDLHFLRDRDLNQSVTVSERGDAVFPKLGMMGVSQLSIAKLQDTLRVRYSEYLRDPELEVQVLRRIVVNGEVKQPNVYLVDISSTVRDAIARAGGLLETANRKNVVVVRNGQRFRVKDWDRTEGPATDLQSGDQVVVGRQPWLVLNALPVISTSVIVIGLIRSIRN